MEASLHSRLLLNRNVATTRRLFRSTLAGTLVAFLLILVVVLASPTLAQVRPEVRDRVIPAVVQIAVSVNVTSNGLTETVIWPMGSGTVVSPNGHILTNWHVADVRTALRDWEAAAAAQGQRASFQLTDETYIILTSDGVNPPQPRYTAALATSDAPSDLAVLQIVGDDRGPVDPASLNLPFVPLGDSDTVGLGDPIDIFGYPKISGGVLTYTQGVVSAFQAEGQFPRAWIITDAVTSGGSSGGTAINREGLLIGVPTMASESDCRSGDTNRDGRVDVRDVGCVPVGGSLGILRPSNFARDLLARAGVTTPSRSGDSDASSGEAEVVDGSGNGSIGSVVEMLPAALPLKHAGCFRVENDQVLGFEDLLTNLGGTDEARGRLQRWGWQESANRIFACDTPPEGEAGWIDISLHLFADANSAQEAVEYFAAIRADGTALVPGAPPAIGDHAAVLSGPAYSGKEFTLYVSRGPLLVRVTGVSRDGIPFINVLTVAQSILARPIPRGQPAIQVPSPQGVEAHLPQSLPLARASCFRAGDILTLDFPSMVARFPGTPNAAERLLALGWETGAYRQFRCENPLGGSVHWIDVSVHRFRDAASAAEAVPFFAEARTIGTQLSPAPATHLGDRSEAISGPSEEGTEYTLYLSSGPLLFRVTGIASSQDPRPAVDQVMLRLLMDSLHQ